MSSGSDDAEQGGTPVVRASDADREAVVARLHIALGEGRIDVDEFGQRATVAHEAATLAELEEVVADLPPVGAPPVEIVGARAAEVVSSVFGDVRLAGATAPQRASSVFGDVQIDLRGLRTEAETVELHLSTVFGDVDVIVAEGVDAELQGWTVFGDRRTELTPLPRLAGTPRVVVRARTVFGDLRLRSLAPGQSAGRWGALLEKLAQRITPPPPPTPPTPPSPPRPPFPPPPF
jgi:hypothetical protein